MGSFKRLQTKPFSQYSTKLSPDTQYWKNYEPPITVREYTAVDYIDVSPVEPYYIAVTTGPKIELYHQQTARVWYSLSRFQRTAYGGNFRHDGQLLIAGSEDGHVRLFNYRLKEMLRLFKGHTGAVHRARFIHGKSQAVSFSDDKKIILWDIAGQNEVSTMEEHTDFIRAGMASPTSEHIVISGSYDHTIKMWDTRTASSVMTVPHNAPVESVLFYPSGSIFASAGGTEVRIWDAVAGKLLSSLSQHHKTITCLNLASDGRCLMSGGLDKHVKVYDVDTYSTVFSMDYSDPVLAVAVSPGDSTLATGMISGGSGLLSFRQRKQVSEPTSKRALKAKEEQVALEDFVILPGDQVVPHEITTKLSKYDQFFKRYEFSKALDEAIRNYMRSKDPTIAVAVVWELIRRKSLAQALAGRDIRTLNNIFKFTSKNFKNPKYRPVLMEMANTLIDIYGDTLDTNPRILKLFTFLQEEIGAELQLTRDYMDLMGCIEMFMSVSSRGDAGLTSEALSGMSAASLAQKALPTKINAASKEARSHEVIVEIND